MIQTSTSFIGIIIGTYEISQMVLRLSVELFSIMALVFLIENLFSGLARVMSFFQASYVL